MSEALQSALADWSPPLPLTLGIALTAAVYLSGWVRLRRTRKHQFSGWRVAAFLSGLTALWIAIASPLESMADVLLSAHMIEHLILMSVVPPALLLGLPVVPLLRGLPRIVHLSIVGPLLRLGLLRSLARQLMRPRVAWLAMNLAFLGWHIPAAYDFALEHEFWHDAEHLCFLLTSLLFWASLMRPWPATRRQRGWSILLYLVSADLINTALSAFLAFCNRVVYPYYSTHFHSLHIDPLSDQILGAAIMWVFGSLAFLLPAAALAFQFLQPEAGRKAVPTASASA
jgi:putative membrane protein